MPVRQCSKGQPCNLSPWRISQGPDPVALYTLLQSLRRYASMLRWPEPQRSLKRRCVIASMVTTCDDAEWNCVERTSYPPMAVEYASEVQRQFEEKAKLGAMVYRFLCRPQAATERYGDRLHFVLLGALQEIDGTYCDRLCHAWNRHQFGKYPTARCRMTVPQDSLG